MDEAAGTQAEPMIRLSGISKTFDKTIHAVRDMDLEVAEGEVLVIVGPSGSGKSTVLRCINLLEVPTTGTVTVDGYELTDTSTDIDHVRAEVGSSNSNTRGYMARARAMATRCCCPPESWRG